MTFASVKSLLKIPSTKLSLFEIFWLGAPIAVWFSYRPLLSLGKNASTNFELSITVVYILLLAISGISSIWRERLHLAENRSVQLVTTFVVVSVVSLLWTPNLNRGILTFGLLGVLYLVFLSAKANVAKLNRLIPALINLFIISAVFMSILSFVQVVAAIWLTREQTLLCAGCAVTQFGFARPNVFTIEPQFFGNVLLAPAIYLVFMALRKKQDIFRALSTGIIIFALFLSLSRGAIFAFGVSFLILLVAVRPSLSRLAKTSATLLISFVLCILTQGFAAAMNPTIDTTFNKAVATSINQLSMGLIDIHIEDQSKAILPAQTPVTGVPIKTAKPKTEAPEIAPNYSGYVQGSTNARLTLSKLAFQSWRKSPKRILFGVGIGGSGVTLRNDFPNKVNDGEIVQNEYVEILLENGIIGFGVFAGIIGMLIYHLRNQKWLWAITAAFLIQWNFFSGFPNALHIYLIFIIMMIGAETRVKPRYKTSLSKGTYRTIR